MSLTSIVAYLTRLTTLRLVLVVTPDNQTSALKRQSVIMYAHTVVGGF